jgi:hypothetical protein
MATASSRSLPCSGTAPVKGSAIPYSAAEMAWLEANRMMVISDYHRAFGEAFGRADVSLANLHALRKRMGWKTGRTGQFVPGQVSHNKGQKCPPGTGGRHPNARRTQFRKGNAPHNTKWLGHERVSKDGYVEISIAEANPHTGFDRRYVLKHRWLWEQANGPVPENMCLKCLGDRLNTDPSNWALVPRGILPRLNGRHTRLQYDTAPDELKPTILAAAHLDHRARALKRKAKA